MPMVVTNMALGNVPRSLVSVGRVALFGMGYGMTESASGGSCRPNSVSASSGGVQCVRFTFLVYGGIHDHWHVDIVTG